jgi:DNA modification methylase
MTKDHEVVEKPIGWFKPAKYNPRKDLKPGDRQYEELKKSITKFGHCQVVVVNKNGTVIGGHQTLKVLRDIGREKAKCIILDLDEKDEKTLNIGLNRIEGEWDKDLIADLLVELDAADVDLDLLGFDESEIKEFVDSKSLGHGDEAEVKDPPKCPKTKFGDLYQLGDHRLLCGDSTKIEDVERLVRGGTQIGVDMLFTDPPYGVSYEEKAVKILGRKDRAVVSGDDGGEEKVKGIVMPAFQNIAKVLKSGGGYYVCSPQGGDLGLMMMQMKDAGISCRHMIIWVKDSPVFSMGRLDYDYQHEPILYGWKGSHSFVGAGEYKTSIWEIKRPKVSKLHPTMKPIALVENAILNSTKKGECVLDLFGGSGTTMIAAENQKRRCCMLEIDPAYCDVIVDRWETHTDKKAVLVKGGSKK